jgi:hypothetical protein
MIVKLLQDVNDNCTQLMYNIMYYVGWKQGRQLSERVNSKTDSPPPHTGLLTVGVLCDHISWVQACTTADTMHLPLLHASDQNEEFLKGSQLQFTVVHQMQLRVTCTKLTKVFRLFEGSFNVSQVQHLATPHTAKE